MTMDILQYGADLLGEKLGLSIDKATIQEALSSLMGDGKGGIDGLMGAAKSFLS
jgi:hypothetical protein